MIEHTIGLTRSLDSYAIHQFLWRGWKREPGTNRPFLWRDLGKGLLVRSTGLPDIDVWLGLPTTRWVTRWPILPTVIRGHDYQFTLRCNPTWAESREGRRSKRRSHTEPAAIIAWLERRGEAMGFQSDDVSVTCIGPVHWNHGGHLATHNCVDLHGHLTVTDVKVFEQTLINGIGAAKSFGFGLIVIDRREY